MKVLGHLMQACAPSEPLCPNKPALCSCVRTGLSDWGAFASPQSPRFWLWKQPVGLYLWSRRTVENSAHRCGFTRKTRKIGRWNADQEEKTALREPQAPLTCLLLLIHLLQAKRLDLAETDRTILPAEYTETWYFCFLIQLSIVNEAYSAYQRSWVPNLSFPHLRLLSLLSLTGFCFTAGKEAVKFQYETTAPSTFIYHQ